MEAEEAIRAAERILPGLPSASGMQDPRWQAIIAVGEHIEVDPERVWQFAARWGSQPDPDIRMAIATCLLEHLLEAHFDLIFPQVEALALQDYHFADTFTSCWQFQPREENAKRMDELADECRKKHANKPSERTR